MSTYQPKCIWCPLPVSFNIEIDIVFFNCKIPHEISSQRNKKKFGLQILGARTLETNITVFKTDYESFAIISNCDKELNDGEIQFSQHTTLWSRSRDISAVFMEKVRNKKKLIFIAI